VTTSREKSRQPTSVGSNQQRLMEKERSMTHNLIEKIKQ